MASRKVKNIRSTLFGSSLNSFSPLCLYKNWAILTGCMQKGKNRIMNNCLVFI
jgi:hypothetical protein